MKTLVEYINEAQVNEANEKKLNDVANAAIDYIEKDGVVTNAKADGTEDIDVEYLKAHLEGQLIDELPAEKLSALLRMMLGVAGAVIASIPATTAALAAAVCLTLCFFCDFTPGIEKLTDKFKDVLTGDDAEFDEGLGSTLLNKMKKLAGKVLLKNDKLLGIMSDIMKTDEYKKAKESDSIKDLVITVFTYFRDNVDKNTANSIA